MFFDKFAVECIGRLSISTRTCLPHFDKIPFLSSFFAQVRFPIYAGLYKRRKSPFFERRFLAYARLGIRFNVYPLLPVCDKTALAKSKRRFLLFLPRFSACKQRFG